MNASVIENPLICPQCHGENSHDAVFCANPECGKALGEFRYVIEEVASSTSRIERIAERVSTFTGSPHFITLHVVWFAAWMVLNSGIVFFVHEFDNFPYSLLSLILSIEAILVTGFLLISQNRQNRHADQRAELDYEVSVRSYRAIRDIQANLELLKQRLEVLERKLGL